ncbi:hypothetical protein BDV96DRAFT_597879 [Lophiotrema nucula]|uniref:SnoaL-like domain-containing protein n=1 Tax=Lophiotrema nucula TaxID=690887 RepID=A0A6A5ZEY2_9PLEO|nr:hypothetical protein BDV96DRAFT_597879 [Lophiotrema nucula]
MPLSRAQLLKTATKFITNFNDPNPDTIIANRTPTCTHEIRPSFGLARTLTNAEYLHWWKTNTLAVMPGGMHLSVDDSVGPVIDVEMRRVVLYVSSHAESIVGVYENTYVWDLRMDGEGERVEYILEFVDSKTVVEFGARVAAASGQAGAALK